MATRAKSLSVSPLFVTRHTYLSKEVRTCAVAEHLRVLALGWVPGLADVEGGSSVRYSNEVPAIRIGPAHLPVAWERALMGRPPGPLQHSV